MWNGEGFCISSKRKRTSFAAMYHIFADSLPCFFVVKASSLDSILFSWLKCIEGNYGHKVVSLPWHNAAFSSTKASSQKVLLAWAQDWRDVWILFPVYVSALCLYKVLHFSLHDIKLW